MEISKGKWKATHYKKGAYNYLIQADAIMIANVVDLPNVFGSSQDNAKLLADAGNTYQSTNKLPSELAEANKELLGALKIAITYVNEINTYNVLNSLIKKHSHA